MIVEGGLQYFFWATLYMEFENEDSLGIELWSCVVFRRCGDWGENVDKFVSGVTRESRDVWCEGRRSKSPLKIM